MQSLTHVIICPCRSTCLARRPRQRERKTPPALATPAQRKTATPVHDLHDWNSRPLPVLLPRNLAPGPFRASNMSGKAVKCSISAPLKNVGFCRFLFLKTLGFPRFLQTHCPRKILRFSKVLPPRHPARTLRFYEVLPFSPPRKSQVLTGSRPSHSLQKGTVLHGSPAHSTLLPLPPSAALPGCSGCSRSAPRRAISSPISPQ